MNRPALSIKSLYLDYPNRFRALDGLTLNVDEGDFFALIGPNGAGKTSLISIITQLLAKTSGRIEVFGIDPDDDPNLVKSYIGVVPQEFNLNMLETCEEIVVQQAGYYGVPRKEALVRAEALLKTFHLWDKRDVIAKKLSGGMKRRLMIVRALMHRPKLLLLDEPTAGVDVELRHLIWKEMKYLNEQGTTIILTTHYLEEAEELCRYLAVIHQGKIALNTSMREVVSYLDRQEYVLEISQPLQHKIVHDDIVVEAIDNWAIMVSIPKEMLLNDVFRLLNEHQIYVTRIRNKRNHLESLLSQICKINFEEKASLKNSRSQNEE